MTRKDYITLAEALKRAKPEDLLARTQWYADISSIAKALETAPKFDAQLFFDNCCGVPE